LKNNLTIHKDWRNRKMSLKETTWFGETIIEFSAGGYKAVMVPGVGANVIQLINLKKEVDILKTPKSLEELKEKPQGYGIPLLFPPNRIENATYTLNDKTYNFPRNAGTTNNHAHGILRGLPFNIVRAEEIEENVVEIEVSFISDKENDAMFVYFDHEFECRIIYRLSKEGLEQKLTFINNSKSPMPLGVGFHTTLNVPFYKGSRREDYRLIISANEKWELSDKKLPTGKILPLNEKENEYRQSGMMPYEFPLDNCYIARPLDLEGRKYHGAILVDTSKDLRVYYEVGEEYKHWTIWNKNMEGDFICPEPQTWTINAPNLDLPMELTGVKLLPPGESWSETSKIYVN
jgi:aldose 1-epimerase